jgi:hypothetical protein
MQPNKAQRREERRRYYRELRELAEQVVDALLAWKARRDCPTSSADAPELPLGMDPTYRPAVVVSTYDAWNRLTRVTCADGPCT